MRQTLVGLLCLGWGGGGGLRELCKSVMEVVVYCPSLKSG